MEYNPVTRLWAYIEKKKFKKYVRFGENFVIFTIERDTIPCTRIRKDTENRLKNRSYGSVS